MPWTNPQPPNKDTAHANTFTFRSSPPKMRMATLAYHGDFEVTTYNSLAAKSIRIPPATPLVGPPNLARFGPRFQPCFCISHHNTITMPRGKELSPSLRSCICELRRAGYS
ncbi:hypothetical protein FOXG_22752 [Fusarium oxysporum f. sp. lycopersici 4287]|uniref:Uncharacterized protein n=2 Tax=Fusarium oxysporum TaxID=5507 RepID=A0A0J9WC41_FUSO4|nr:hypothetical protein FOXG_22752 [Fusarium oxysporum f. sp. lycopersici 4287]KNB20110.1 hypothetical protein FOXG_22752 [Fusarium oxysporum f. sp. lycopersici 4287]